LLCSTIKIKTDMRLINYLQTKLPALAIFSMALALTSCGSYQYVGQNSDGIYGEDNRQVQATPEKQQETTGNEYYKNYFKEKSLEMEAESQGNEVFVDVDSYQGNYSDENTEESYGAWGENGNEVTINVYENNGWGFYNNWNRPFWGWNRWGWNRNFVGWNGGFWNGGFYNSFWCPPYYGYGFANGFGYGYPYNYGYYGRNNGYGRGLAYNNTRRGGLSRTTLNRRNNTSSRVRTTRSTTRNSFSTSRSNRRVRANSSSNNAPTRRPQSTRTTRSTRNNSSTVRPNRSTPRTNRSYTPSRSSTRSSGFSRGSSRSSGGASRSSGSSSRRGRG